jgi:transcriptional regulator with XRE-family HTH domain
MTPMLDGLGLRIRTARRERGLSAAEVAVSITRSVHTVYLWEQGKSMPTVPDVIALAPLLGCDLRWLLTGAGPMKSSEERAA